MALNPLGQAVQKQLAQKGTTAAAFRSAQSPHILTVNEGTDGDRKLCVLIPESLGIDTLETEVQGANGNVIASLPTEAVASSVTLADDEASNNALGSYKAFLVDVSTLPTATQGPGNFLRLSLNGGNFHTDLDASFALNEIVYSSGAQLPAAVRSMELLGEASHFIKVDPPIRWMFYVVSGKSVDEYVTKEEFQRAYKVFERRMQESAPLQSLALALGIDGEPALPSVSRETIDAVRAATTTEPTTEGIQLSTAFLEFLNSKDLAAPTNIADWETLLDDHADTMTESMVAEARRGLSNARTQDANDFDTLFGIESSATEAPVVLNAGASRIMQASAYNKDRLMQLVGHLGVDASTCARLSEMIAAGTADTRKPTFVVVCGNSDSAAERLIWAGQKLVDSASGITIRPSDLDGTGAVLGHKNNIPLGSDGILSVRSKSKEAMSLVFENLSEVDNEGLLSWLRVMGAWAESGKATVYFKPDLKSPVSEPNEVALGKTVFLLRWNDTPEAFSALIKQNEDLKFLAANMISAPAFSTQEATAYFSEELALRTKAGVQLSVDVMTSLQALASTGAGERKFVVGELLEKFVQKIGELASAVPPPFEVTWNDGLMTAKEKAKFLSNGKLPAGVNPFTVTKQLDDNRVVSFELPLVSNWTSIESQAAEAAALREEVERIQQALVHDRD